MAVLYVGMGSVHCLFAQNYTELNSEKITFDGYSRKEQGRKFSFNRDTALAVIGSGNEDKLLLKKLELYSSSYTQATLKVEFEFLNSKKSFTEIPGDFFITIAFFDEDKNCLFSEQLTSRDGMRLVDGPDEMNEMETHYINDGFFKFTGSRDIGVHQAFMYSGEGAAGIKPIKYFSIRVCHLGAG